MDTVNNTPTSNFTKFRVTKKKKKKNELFEEATSCNLRTVIFRIECLEKV